jgi:serralysin
VAFVAVNQPPVITSNGAGDSASVNVPENSTAVTTVTATDPDVGTTLVYSIGGGADATQFAINPSAVL